MVCAHRSACLLQTLPERMPQQLIDGVAPLGLDQHVVPEEVPREGVQGKVGTHRGQRILQAHDGPHGPLVPAVEEIGVGPPHHLRHDDAELPRGVLLAVARAVGVEDLRRHVEDGPDALGQGPALERLGQAEIADLGLSVPIDHHILQLEVAVQDILLMQVLQTLCTFIQQPPPLFSVLVGRAPSRGSHHLVQVVGAQFQHEVQAA
mmetsp:Transcript_81617/g.143919  ORF Transcript_81617/g.143919 Transcript_81617/m.143919 type:complete len:206 (+) Transcript_81617:823-1440(+)